MVLKLEDLHWLLLSEKSIQVVLFLFQESTMKTQVVESILS